jgi:hypothetical protein
MRSPLRLCFPAFQLLNQVTDFHKILSGRFAITENPNVLPFNFLQLVQST